MLCAVTGFQMFRVAPELAGVRAYRLSPVPGLRPGRQRHPRHRLQPGGGRFADRLNKRILVFSTQGSTGLFILVMGLLTLLGVVEVWHILVIAFLAGAAEAFDTPGPPGPLSPPHRAFRHDQRRGPELHHLAGHPHRRPGHRRFHHRPGQLRNGPGGFVGGVLHHVRGDALPPHSTHTGGGAPQSRPRLWEGMAFIGKNSIFAFLIGMTFFNSFFGMAYVLLMPVFAVDVLEVGAGDWAFCWEWAALARW